MEIFVISKIWQFFSKILEKLVKSTLESMIFKKFPNSFYQKKTTFVCVCVCVCVCDTDCSDAAGLGPSYSSITDQCEGGIGIWFKPVPCKKIKILLQTLWMQVMHKVHRCPYLFYTYSHIRVCKYLSWKNANPTKFSRDVYH